MNFDGLKGLIPQRTWSQKRSHSPGVVVHLFNPSTQEAEVGGSLCVLCQSGPYRIKALPLVSQPEVNPCMLRVMQCMCVGSRMSVKWRRRHFENELGLSSRRGHSLGEVKHFPLAHRIFIFLYIYTLARRFPYLKTTWMKLPKIQCQVQTLDSGGTMVFQRGENVATLRELNARYNTNKLK